MTAITFDTFKFVRRLKDAGIPENQAEAISEAIQETHANQFEDMAAKRDLKELEGQLSTKADVTKVEVQVLELKRDIKELELRMAAEMAPLKWGMAVCVGGIIALILKTFFPH
ncbi:MAG: CCDC90 family protein [Magnetococcus sp. MYC-9]